MNGFATGKWGSGTREREKGYWISKSHSGPLCNSGTITKKITVEIFKANEYQITLR